MSQKLQLLWSRSAVYIHPTKQSSENIPGYLSLTRSGDGEVLVSWVPESLIRLSKQDLDTYLAVELDESGDVQSDKQVYVSAPLSVGSAARSTHAFSVPVSKLFSLQVREPSLGWWYGSVLFFTRNQEPMPALFFHDDVSEIDKKRRREMTKADNQEWGGRLFLKKLGEYAKIVPSSLEKGVYLVNPETKDKLAFSPPLPSSSSASPSPKAKPKPAWSDLKWNMLEKLAQVTRISRRASQKVFDNSPAPVRAMLSIPEVERLGEDFDSARVFLAEWALGIAKDQEDMERQKIDVIWTDSMDDGFSLVSTQAIADRRNPVTLEEWRSFFDENAEGRLCITAHEVKDRIFHGGLEPPARAEAWLFLLGVYPWGSSKVERQSILSERQQQYYRLKRQWWENVDKQQDDEFWKDQLSRIEKDVLRTDRHLPMFAQSEIPHPDPESRFASSGANPHLEQLKDILVTYNEYNVNLGYVQGMTDLLSPLYVVLQDDSLAFIAFCEFMKRMERNFIRSQEGMRDQLQTLGRLTRLMIPQLHTHLAKAESAHFFFFFRMILVWYKREFGWDDVLRLWEVLWTDYYSSQFHLFIALAVLDLNKEIIIGRLHYFDEILKYINNLEMTLDLDVVLARAEQLFLKFKMTLDLVDRQKRDGQADVPEITDDLKQLLSKHIVEQYEVEREPGTGGG